MLPDIHVIIDAITALAVIGLLLVAIWLLLGKGSVNPWSRLSNLFGTDQKPDHYDFRFTSIILDWLSLRNIVFIAILDKGLYIGMLAIFRIGMRNILIPWKELKPVSPPKAINRIGMTWMIGYGTKLEIGTPVITTLWMPKKAYERMVPYLDINKE